MQPIALAGLAVGVDRFNQHGEQAEAIADHHIGEQAIANQGHLARWQLQFGQHPPQGRAPGLAGGVGEGQIELRGHGADAVAGWIVAKQVNRQLLAGGLQPQPHRFWYQRLAAGQQGAIHIQHQGPNRHGGALQQGGQRQFSEGARDHPIRL